MKRVGVVSFSNLWYAPYIKFYTDLLDTIEEIEYEVIYYNRDRSLNEPDDGKYIPVPWIGRGTTAAPKIEKLANLVFWKVYVNRLLRKKKYDFLIVVTTTAAVLLEKYLTNEYAGRYIFDVRDYTQEHVKQFFEAEKRLAAHSKLNIISSPGFKKFLPKGEYKMCHNLSGKNGEDRLFRKKTTQPIQISYIGSISYEDQCVQLMRLVDKDERFSFIFYGNENTSHRVSEEAARLNNPRIKLMGPFKPDEKARIYGESALVFNCYGNQRPLVLHAISNKHYDGALYRVPVLNSPGTIMDELAGKYGCSLDLDHLENLDGLYEWYMNLDEAGYERYAKCVVENASQDNLETRGRIISAIKGS